MSVVVSGSNIIPFPPERLGARVTVSRGELEAFFLGRHCRHESVEASVMAWLKTLPPARCQGRAARAMRVHLTQASLYKSYPQEECAVACMPPVPGHNLRQRQVLAFLGAISRHCCASRQCRRGVVSP